MENAKSTSILERRQKIDEIDAAISKISRSINSANYELMVLIREFDERAGWLKWGFTDCVSWLKWRCDLSDSAARDKLRIARALKDLAQMSDEFSKGTLSYSKVRALTRVSTPANEAELITMAHKMSASHVEQHCRQRKNASPDSSKHANSAYEARSLRSWRNEERGMMTITLEVPIEEGELFEKAVDKAAANLSNDAYASNAVDDNKTSWCAMQADAAIAIAKAHLSGSAGTDAPRASSSADHYQVMVHVDEAALTGRMDEAEGATAQSDLPIDTVRRLCCDGSIVPIVENAKGEPLSVGRKVRTVTTAVRRALWARDKGCAFPGCSHTRYVDAHHIKHWADGGETSAENMVLLCSQHHRMVHEGGYSILNDHAGNHYFKRPDGKAVPECGYHEDDWMDECVDTTDKDYEDYSVSQNSAAFYRVGEPEAAYSTAGLVEAA